MIENKRYDYKISDDELEESIDISGFDEMVYFPNDVFTEKNVEKVVDKLNEQWDLIIALREKLELADKQNTRLEKENHMLNGKINRLTDELANCYEKLGW